MTTYTSSGTYTVQATRVLKIAAYGGAGGAGFGARAVAGGNGAEVGGYFTLTQGDTIKIVVGGAGGYGSNYAGGGGGGGTFVIDTTRNTTLLIAGGGGGGGENGSVGGGGLTTVQNGGNPGAGGGGNYGGGGGGFSGGVGGTILGVATAGSNSPGSYTGGAAYSGSADSGGYGGGGGGSAGGGGGGGDGGGAGGNYVGVSGAHAQGNGGGGGGSLIGSSAQNGTSFSTAAENNGAGFVTLTPLCFLRGTRILTTTGEVAVEDLKIGDLVVTRFSGMQPVKWLGRHSHEAGDPANTPVCICAGALGERLPARPLYVSPGHSVLVGGTLLIARLLVNGVTVTQNWCPPRIDYIHVELPVHDCVIAEGAYAETYADANISRTRFDNYAEYDALYPDDGPAPEEFVLCAPRPERGAKLEAALRPVVARVRVPPGPLRGSIDRIDGVWRVQGWAHDAAHPQLPVLLEVELGGCVIGTVAACEERGDLAQAGIGGGRCAFTFTSPVRLRPELLPTLRIRRAADAAPLPIDPRCAATLPGTAPKAALRLVA